MDLDPGEENPMWARREALAASPYASHRGPAPREDERALRIAMTSVEVRAILDGEHSAECVSQVVTWDAPLILLADDTHLADRVTALGVHVVLRGGTYAERQWDAREALEEVAHRYYDHGEGHWGVRGMITRQAHTTVAIVQGTAPVLAVLGVLMQRDDGPGIVIDARDPLDLRVFGVEALAQERVILVRTGGVEEHRRVTIVGEALRDLLREA